MNELLLRRRVVLGDYPVSPLMSLTWNQRVVDGNFDAGSVPTAYHSTCSVQDNVLTIRRSGTYSVGLATPNTNWYSGTRSKWFVSCEVYETVDSTVQLELSTSGYNNVGVISPEAVGGSRIGAVINMNHLNNSYFRVRLNSAANGAYAKVGKLMAISLTRMFGSGKEPTAEDFMQLFPYDYYYGNTGETIKGYIMKSGVFSVQPLHLQTT